MGKESKNNTKNEKLNIKENIFSNGLAWNLGRWIRGWIWKIKRKGQGEIGKWEEKRSSLYHSCRD